MKMVTKKRDSQEVYAADIFNSFFFKKSDIFHCIVFPLNFSAQLNEIRKSSVARLFCDNGNHIESIQRSAFWKEYAQLNIFQYFSEEQIHNVFFVFDF